MILKELNNGNLKVCQPKNLLLLPLLIIVFPYQLNGTKIKFCLVFKGSCLKQKIATYTPNNGIIFFIVYKLDLLPQDLDFYFSWTNSLFKGVKFAKNANPDKYPYSGYGTGFNTRTEFSLHDGSIVKNVIIFGIDASSSVYIDNKGGDILILGRGPTQALDDTTLTAETQYLINFTRPNIKFCLSLHYIGSDSFLFVSIVKYIS